ncbi:hypothetical protein BGX28_003050 [Mortierella sp. GBA30]|nr:hypothetical protein BGX28_003050 [Mortierella sp. GBA30]
MTHNVSNNRNENLPRVVLGAMTFGQHGKGEMTTVKVVGVEAVKPFLETFHSFGHVEVDTARIYGNGDSETVLSMLPTAHLKISTKVYPGFPGAHEPENLKKQFRQSLEALKTNKVDILYLHAPDHATPFELTIKAIDDLYREGHFERFGLSNFLSWQVAQIYELCKKYGYVLPSVYQGMYNPIARSVVPELLPCLKSYNIGFYAYNPIGGGLLTGRYKAEDDVVEGSRYDPNTGFGKLFRDRYWNKLTFEGIQILNKAATDNNLTLLEATLRWMRHHSGLEGKDGIIIGASSIHHLEANLAGLDKGPLPQAMIDAFDAAWEHVMAASPYYYRGPTQLRLTFGITKE